MDNMTNDYKENILQYITNNVVESPYINNPVFSDITEINKEITSEINTKLSAIGADSSLTTFKGYHTDETSQNILIYGTYGFTGELKSYGWIYMCDKELNEVAFLTTFTSGTKLFPFARIEQDADGTFYGITDEIYLVKDRVARVILLNNIFVKVNNEYRVSLRASYIIPNNTAYTFSYMTGGKVIIKDPKEATYYILGCIINQISGAPSSGMAVIKFKNNVGEENEWYEYTTQDIGSHSAYDVLLENKGEKTKLYIYSQRLDVLKEVLLEDDTLSLTRQCLLPKENNSISAGKVLAKSKDEQYLSYTFSGSPLTTYVVKVINFHPTILNQYSYTGNTIYPAYMELKNNIVFLITRDPSEVKVGIIQDGEDKMSSEQPYSSGRFFPLIYVSYNLVNIYVKGNNKTNRYNLDYNPLNYNGNQTTSYEQTRPVKGRLYSNGVLSFARNLYNTTINGSTCTSTLQIPNTLLNNDSITQENLVGQSNCVLVSKGTTINKNIYETLYINFTRSLKVKDEDTNTMYQQTANYINQNINIATKQNCLNTFVGKVRINYTNNTVVQDITWEYVSGYYQTSFVIDATNEIPTLDFLSNDESTIYISKELNIQTGNYYIINQKLRIE